LRLRPIWFALSALLLGAAYLAAAGWIGGKTGWRLGLLFSLFWLSFPVQAGLQMGNFHLPMVALSVLAMLAFARRREALGGALLAFAVAAKLSPAVLVVYLAVRRRWRAMAFTAGSGALLVAMTWLVFGAQPFRAFVQEHVPRLASGEAFSFVLGPQAAAARPGPVASNLSPFGLVLKLQQLGVPGMNAALARVVSLAYLALVVLLAAFTARRQAPEPDRRGSVLVWLALISLAAFQAPFIPGNYGTLSVIWLVLVVAAGARRAWVLVPLALIWGLCWLLPGFLPAGPAMFVYGVLFQLILMAVCVLQLVVVAPAPQPVRPPRRFLVNV
jgi:alpha-1,2-mannosyltransferase